jgi:hypothetical protein
MPDVIDTVFVVDVKLESRHRFGELSIDRSSDANKNDFLKFRCVKPMYGFLVS